MSGNREGELLEAVRVVRRGGVVSYPTDTVYGLGALALRKDAVRRVLELKGRGPSRPVSVAVADWEMAALVVDAEACTGIAGKISELLPGPYTLLLPSRDGLPPALVGPQGLVGLRIPDHPLALSLARRCGPLTATSANRSGERPPRSAGEVSLHADYLLDGGPCPAGQESTVFDPIAKNVLRRGAGYREVMAWLQTMPD